MPFYIHLKSIKLADNYARHTYDGDTFHVVRGNQNGNYRTRASAFDSLEPGEEKTHVISYRPTDLEIERWQRREYNRFDDGTYEIVPWNALQRSDLRNIHFAHLSTEKVGMVAFTPDVEAGIADKQTRMSAGRYLERFYKTHFSQSDIAEYVAQVAAFKTATFNVAKTESDVRKVYTNGPGSCMGGGARHTDQYWRQSLLAGHLPCDVYADGPDLVVAYVGTLDSPSQRSVIWPEKKSYVRIYGTGPLERLLKRGGYEAVDCFDGARIRRIELKPGRWLMCYIDPVSHNAHVKVDPKDDRYFVLCGCEDGEYDAQTTCGFVGDDNDDEEETEYAECRNCGNEQPYDDMFGDLCSCCDDLRYSCDHCEQEYFDHDHVSVNGETWCESCVEHESLTCDDNGCGDTWIECDEFTREEQRERRIHETDMYCRECAKRFRWCDACSVSYDSRDHAVCPDCAAPPPVIHPCGVVRHASTSEPISIRRESEIEPATLTETQRCEFPYATDCPVMCATCHGDKTACSMLIGTSVTFEDRAHDFTLTTHIPIHIETPEETENELPF